MTWNVNQNFPPDNIADVLGLQRDPDLLALGLQEVIPPNSKVESYTFRHNWRRAIEAILHSKGYSRVTWGSESDGTCLGIYAKRKHSVKEPLVTFLHTEGPESGHRSGIWVRFSMLGRKMGIITTHYTHADVSLDRRLEDFCELENKTEDDRFPKEDYKIWFGDLNFRLKDQNELTAEKIAEKIAKGQENELLEKDELRSAMKEGKVFQGYSESEISFKPTYKFELGTSRYDLSRRPAWTDRVLYRAAPGRDITPVYYGSIPHLSISDHKPVEAFFRIPLGSKQNDTAL